MLRFSHSLGDNAELRPANVADAPALFACVDGARDALSPWLPWVKDMRSTVDAGAFMRDAQLLHLELRALYASIWVGDALVGLACLDPIDLATQNAFLGWWLAPEARGRGIAGRAAAAMRDEAFARWRLDEVLAKMLPTNHASAVLAERLGLVADPVFGQREPAERIYRQSYADWSRAHIAPSQSPDAT
ncbi:MAG: ribosomal-protein-serine acetyltransferase [Bradymonadia bacterium]|jgi:ribosomal-protein-serine acetyltransferase